MSKGAKALGRWGEAVAARYLAERGYKILAKNWRCAFGEIDLVALDSDVYVAVEVKTRRGTAYGSPEAAITPRKAEKLSQLTLHYQLAHDLEDVPWRIDIIALELDADGRLRRCHHIPDAVRGW